MSSYNLGLAFYRKYYEDWDFTKDEAKKGLQDVEYPRDKNDVKGREKMEQTYFAFKSKPLKEQTIPASSLYGYSDKHVNESIQLTTTYPGLLLGSGYAHGIGKQGEHKIGFYFDHTTGLPVIPGSSIKGALRSVFPLRYSEKAKETEKKSKPKEAEEYKEEADNRRQYLLDLIKNRLKLPAGEVNGDWIDRLEREIFDGIYDFNKEKPKYMPTTFRDIFHDAILSGPENTTFLGDDFITPHKNTTKDKIPDALKNPNPIQFLKVLPGKSFTFQFRLTDSYFFLNTHTQELEKKKRLLSAEHRRLLFQAILEDIGIGAKTNVGYGQLVDPNRPPTKAPDIDLRAKDTSTKASEKRKQTNRPSVQKPEPLQQKNESIEPIEFEKVRRGTEVKGKVIDNKNRKIIFELDVIGYEEPVEVSYGASSLFEIGAYYKLIIKQIQRVGSQQKLIIDAPSPKNKIN